ncbi:MAG TPA: hypothetical protein VFF58_00520 [Candidatus Nitrosotalea sp.]|nr:hypothetical protein [Candidatus Nitrosotalea sp.]
MNYLKVDLKRYDELQQRAREWWHRVGHGQVNRGSFMCQMVEGGGVFDISELLADFGLQLPFQEKAANLPKADAAQLLEIVKHLMAHDPYRKALEDHMRTCPGPPLLLFQRCPKCGAELNKL